MAIISCTINEPITLLANFCDFTPNSSNVFKIIVVDEMDKITPKKILFILFHPNACPTKKPIVTMVIICDSAVIDAVPPTLISFLKLNSNPKLNNKNITPISAHTFTLSISCTVGKKSK